MRPDPVAAGNNVTYTLNVQQHGERQRDRRRDRGHVPVNPRAS